MILFNENIDREIKRNALGLKRLVIDNSLCNGMEIVCGFNQQDRTYIIKSATEAEIVQNLEEKKINNECTEDDMICLVDEFSAVKNFNTLEEGAKTILEVTFHGSLMQLNIIKGCLLIKQPLSKGEEICLDKFGRQDIKSVLAFRDSEFLERDGIKIDLTEKWVTTEKLKSYCMLWKDTDSAYVEDMIYTIEVSCDKNDVFSVKLIGKTDISLGELNNVKQRELENKNKIKAVRLQSRINKAVEEDSNDDDVIDYGTGSLLDDNEDDQNDDEGYEDIY